MPDLSQIEALRLRLEEEKCPAIQYRRGEDSNAHDDEGPLCICHGTGLNPEYAALLEVVAEKCCACNGVGSHKAYPPGGDYRSECKVCKGANFITRSWEGMPPTGKALEGSLYHGLHCLWRETNDNRLLIYLEALRGDLIDIGDTRLAAVQAVSEALGKKGEKG